MKKIMSLLLVSLLLLSISVVANEHSIVEETDEFGCKIDRGFKYNINNQQCERDVVINIQAAKELKSQIVEQAKTLNKDRLEIQSRIVGLENAILRVRKNETKLHLEEILNKITAKKLEVLNNLEELIIEEIDDEIIARGKKEGRFLGFIKAKRTLKFQITEDGEMIRVKNFFDFLWSE